jgi:hypothetical protein
MTSIPFHRMQTLGVLATLVQNVDVPRERGFPEAQKHESKCTSTSTMKHCQRRLLLPLPHLQPLASPIVEKTVSIHRHLSHEAQG